MITTFVAAMLEFSLGTAFSGCVLWVVVSILRHRRAKILRAPFTQATDLVDFLNPSRLSYPLNPVASHFAQFWEKVEERANPEVSILEFLGIDNAEYDGVRFDPDLDNLPTRPLRYMNIQKCPGCSMTAPDFVLALHLRNTKHGQENTLPGVIR